MIFHSNASRRSLRALLIPASALLGLAALAGCNDSSAEEAGEEIDEAIEEAGDEIEEATDG
tara:strand:+ start:232 stop:414 length:183 start_codon:yes stop_codon:yes gene_type:complete